MKNLKKLLVGFLCVFAMLVIIKVPANADSRFWQTGATQNTISVAWDSSVFGSRTVTSVYVLYNGQKIQSSSKYSMTLSASENFADYVSLYYTYSGSSYSVYIGSCYINTIPTVVPKANFGIYSNLGASIRLGVARPSTGMSGALIQVYKNNAYVGTYDARYKGSSHFYTDTITPAKNAIYKYRVIYYYDNPSTGQRVTSPAYSEFRQFVIPSVSGKAKSNKKGFSMKLKRITGASKFVVQLSQDNATFKTAKTVKISKKKKTYSFQVTKKYKKRTTNYIKVHTYISGYGYSDYVWNGRIYVFK